MDKEKAKENRMVQQFFKNKVFWGIDSVPLKRKIYRGKRDKNGSRKNECFYVSEDQKYQIEEVRLKRESPVCMSEKILRFKKKLIK